MKTEKKILLVFLIFPVLLCCLFISSCRNNKKIPTEISSCSDSTISGDLIIFHAGSLSIPFRKIKQQFNKEYPNVNVIMEAAGSVACARKITDLNRACDIIASADYKVIDKLLIPKYTGWNIKFVSNEMGIVFNDKSAYNNEITKDNWVNILLRNDVIFGRSNPNFDPCGYRAVLTIKLSEKYYKKPELTNMFLRKDLNYIRPKEVDLLSLLETNTIDYIFIYRSVAEQHRLKYLLLPDEINLKNPELADLYSTVSVNVAGENPGSVITTKGEPIVYGITILKNAPNIKAANAFLIYLLTENKGMSIMQTNGQSSLIPAFSETYDNIPENLKQFSRKSLFK